MTEGLPVRRRDGEVKLGKYFLLVSLLGITAGYWLLGVTALQTRVQTCYLTTCTLLIHPHFLATSDDEGKIALIIFLSSTDCMV